MESLSEQRIPAVLAIEKQSNPLPWSERSFRNELVNPQSIFQVAIADGKPAGYVGVWVCIDEAHITTIAVTPEWRRKGIAKKLLSSALEKAADRGALCATLEVRAGNVEAISLYEAFGFKRVSVRKRYYPNDHEDAVVMWLERIEVAQG